MSREKYPNLEEKYRDSDFLWEFHVIPKTRLSINYVNYFSSAADPLHASPPQIEEVKERFKEIPNYREYTEDAVRNHNADVQSHQYKKPVSIEDFIGPDNIDLIEEIEKIITNAKRKVSQFSTTDRESMEKLIKDLGMSYARLHDIISGKQ